MIQTQPGSPVLHLRVAGAPVGGAVSAVDMVLSHGAHDEATLFIAGPSGLNYTSTQRQLIYFAWGTGYVGRFYGYVTSITPQRVDNKTDMTYKVVAQGPTFPMKAGRPRFFTEMTVADVIKLIAAEYQLGFRDEYGSKHYVWRQLAQTDESDWTFVNQLCERVGAMLVCTAGVLRLIDPMAVLTRSTPLEFATKKEDGNPNVFDFLPTHYSDRLPGNNSPTVAYLSNGKVAVQEPPHRLDVTTKSTGYFFSAARPCRNQEEAKLAQINMPIDWEEQATVTLQHAARVEPGSVIALRTGYAAANLAKYDGFWYVLGVTHRLGVGIATATVDLARVSKAPRLPGVDARQWQYDPRGRPQLVPTANGNWMSTWR